MFRAEIGAMSSIRLRCLGSTCKGPEANSATRHSVWSVKGGRYHLITSLDSMWLPRAGQTPVKLSDKRLALIVYAIRADYITG